MTGSVSDDALLETLKTGPLHPFADFDTVSGSGGNDRLNGGPGADRMQGGSRKDSLNARDRKRDTVDCGSGRDRVAADKLDRLRRCERVRR